MEIKIVNKQTQGDLIVTAKWCDRVLSGGFETEKSAGAIKFKINRLTDVDEDVEEVLRSVCQKVWNCALKRGCKDIVFDLNSFVDNSVSISYLTNVLIEELSAINADNVTATIVLPEGENSELLDELDEELSKPVIETVNQSYGDYGDPLKEQFKEFQKTFEKEKTFREHLVDLMERKGVRKNSDVYKASGISKYTFSRLINFSLNPPHKPSKETVAALTIGLKLNLEEAEEFYFVAGFSLGKTEFLDKVIRFFIHKGLYKIDEVNSCLTCHGQPLLGEKVRGDNPKVIIK